MNTVIEPTVNVTRSSRIVSIATAGSNRYVSTSEAPVSRDSATCPIEPVMWNSGATPRITSRGPMPIQSR